MALPLHHVFQWRYLLHQWHLVTELIYPWLKKKERVEREGEGEHWAFSKVSHNIFFSLAVKCFIVIMDTLVVLLKSSIMHYTCVFVFSPVWKEQLTTLSAKWGSPTKAVGSFHNNKLYKSKKETSRSIVHLIRLPMEQDLDAMWLSYHCSNTTFRVTENRSLEVFFRLVCLYRHIKRNFE